LIDLLCKGEIALNRDNDSVDLKFVYQRNQTLFVLPLDTGADQVEIYTQPETFEVADLFDDVKTVYLPHELGFGGFERALPRKRPLILLDAVLEREAYVQLANAVGRAAARLVEIRPCSKIRGRSR
jgi:hypothetical protein